MRVHPNTAFGPTDTAILTKYGYCVGYDLDGNPEPAMAVHPVTGMIIRTFFNGCSIWHPAINRMGERVSHGVCALERVLGHEGYIKRINAYSSWRNRSSNYERLANLRKIAEKS